MIDPENSGYFDAIEDNNQYERPRQHLFSRHTGVHTKARRPILIKPANKKEWFAQIVQMVFIIAGASVLILLLTGAIKAY